MDIKNLIKLELKKCLPDLCLDNCLSPCIDTSKGDYNIICFPMAKEQKCSPIIIANNIKDKIKCGGIIKKCEVVNGYVNLFIDNEFLINNFLDEYKNGKLFDIEQTGKGKTCFIDFSSINLAKYMHIGHLSGTAIGASIARVLESVGYKVIKINYIGDSGTSFGKVIAGYKLWGNEQELNERGIDYLQELYVKFNREEEKDPNLKELAKAEFVKLEKGDPTTKDLHKKFSQITIDEAKRLFEMMNITFDDWRGEAFYTEDIIKASQKKLMASGLVKTSQGAKIIDLQDESLGVALIEKSDGASTYLARDICAIQDRYNLYHFDKGYYETGVEQSNHFAQLFEICKKLNLPFANGLKHITHGMITTPTGKISSRAGKQAVLADIFEIAINKARDLLIERNYSEEKINEIAKAVGISSVIFSVLKTERIKGSVFDMEKSISFDGETAPYIQYTYARANSVLSKSNNAKLIEDKDSLNNSESLALIKLLNDYENIIFETIKDCEPCYLSRFLLELCKLYNVFYTQHRIMYDDGDKVDKYRLELTKAVREALARIMSILGIAVIDVM